ncbi:MAG: hypothetical protein OXB92_12810, partial [Acidimicrobiaceae bacterium]|nr:hypothetical protein [Acidimicrobiaceae bacterium]
TPDEGYTHVQTLEMIEVFGKYVIPEFDQDPVHSTTRYRSNAEPQFPVVNGDVDPVVDAAVPPSVPDRRLIPGLALPATVGPLNDELPAEIPAIAARTIR